MVFSYLLDTKHFKIYKNTHQCIPFLAVVSEFCNVCSLMVRLSFLVDSFAGMWRVVCCGAPSEPCARHGELAVWREAAWQRGDDRNANLIDTASPVLARPSPVPVLLLLSPSANRTDPSSSLSTIVRNTSLEFARLRCVAFDPSSCFPSRSGLGSGERRHRALALDRADPLFFSGPDEKPS